MVDIVKPSMNDRSRDNNNAFLDVVGVVGVVEEPYNFPFNFFSQASKEETLLGDYRC